MAGLLIDGKKRGETYKQLLLFLSWYENSARVPMIINGPNIAPKKVKESVSTMDLLPTFVDPLDPDRSSIIIRLTALSGTVAARADITQVFGRIHAVDYQQR
ncbi:hypothetical protein J4E90_010253 [Alternaria incomplexa]|uniref:uncharacterized protein n=1 Tax=Alternaria incomplexa TaxID=1187928 RepID=UPI00221F0BB6|nr:uncharacterized protein J4E90_010253 [Alternaria incomplexa]KAI4906793.1 hypothetical protein J4E90_010253 [Alternaria incomplexa]